MAITMWIRYQGIVQPMYWIYSDTDNNYDNW